MKRHYAIGLMTAGAHVVVGTLSLAVGSLVVAGAIASLAVVAVPAAVMLSR